MGPDDAKCRGIASTVEANQFNLPCAAASSVLNVSPSGVALLTSFTVAKVPALPSGQNVIVTKVPVSFT